MELKLFTKPKKSKNFSANTSILRESLNLEKKCTLENINSNAKINNEPKRNLKMMLKNFQGSNSKDFISEKFKKPSLTTKNLNSYIPSPENYRSPRNRSSSLQKKLSEKETQLRTETTYGGLWKEDGGTALISEGNFKKNKMRSAQISTEENKNPYVNIIKSDFQYKIFNTQSNTNNRKNSGKIIFNISKFELYGVKCEWDS
jgi:hypothetical protein